MVLFLYYILTHDKVWTDLKDLQYINLTDIKYVLNSQNTVYQANPTNKKIFSVPLLVNLIQKNSKSLMFY